jgi:Predicted enzyme with a TIM-barrel fold
VEICGLMGIATFTDDIKQVEQEFTVLQELFNKMKKKYAIDFPNFKELSMGMSGDYHIAMKHDSTLIRIGTQIFGPRNYNAL